MKTLLKTLLAVALLLVLGTAALAWQTWHYRPLRLEWFLDRVLIEELRDNPEELSSLRLVERYGLRGHNARLTDESPEAIDRRAQRTREQLDQLRRYYGSSALSPSERLSYQVVEWELASRVAGEAFRDYEQPLNPVFGIQNSLPSFLTHEHHLGDVRDAQDYIARLRAIEPKFDQLLASLKRRHDRQILPQRFATERLLAQLKGFVAMPAADNLLVSSFSESLEKLPQVDAATRAALVAQATAAVSEAVMPAYARLIDYHEALLPRLPGNDGAWALPEGEAYYAWCVRRYTTTAMTPDQVHALGLREVARIEGEMGAILRAQGLARGSVGARLQQLAAEPRFAYADSDAGRAQILADYQRLVDEIDAGVAPYFNRRPLSKVQVRRVPEFMEGSSPGAYYESPPLDGSRPGSFWVNLRNVGETQKFGMRTLVYHEAIPGHHFQIALAQEQGGLPLLQKLLGFTAYTEGWALYAERLAQEIGYEQDPYDNLGRLQAELMRAVRLVVDTGLHQRRWTREQAITYMRDTTGLAESDVVAEIERYLVWPGQALAYKIGMNRILELREQARAAAGPAFDLRAFHDVVLGSGAVPLDVLGERVQAAFGSAR